MITKPLYRNSFLSVEQDEDTGWSFVRTVDAAAVLVYLSELDSVLLVSQKRPAMVNDENPSGECLEPVAGRIDYEASVKELLANELREEAGVQVNPNTITLLNSGKPLASSPGLVTERKYLAYVEVRTCQVESLDDLEKEYGNQHEGEKIKRHLISVKDLEQMIFGDFTLFALVQWFLKGKKS